MPIRIATFADLAAIRELPVQMTNRPSGNILYKHWRVLVLEARTQLFVYEDKDWVKGFIALRKMPPEDDLPSYLYILHFSFRTTRDRQLIMEQFMNEAANTMVQLHCAGLMVCTIGLPTQVQSWYAENGFRQYEDKLIKPIRGPK